jgi:hypothetical protein
MGIEPREAREVAASRYWRVEQKVDEDNRTKAAETRPPRTRNLVPSWKRLPIGWIVIGLVVVSWVAFFLMTDGITLLIHH